MLAIVACPVAAWFGDLKLSWSEELPSSDLVLGMPLICSCSPIIASSCSPEGATASCDRLLLPPKTKAPEKTSSAVIPFLASSCGQGRSIMFISLLFFRMGPIGRSSFAADGFIPFLRVKLLLSGRTLALEMAYGRSGSGLSALLPSCWAAQICHWGVAGEGFAVKGEDALLLLPERRGQCWR
ncbi:hypothetical protein ACLOJK_028385 [Asimina triloba]